MDLDSIQIEGKFMQVIDIETWNRKDHFYFFKTVPYPVYNICFDINVSVLKSYAQDRELSFNLSMIYIVTEAINEIDNFKYRLRKDEVILHQSLTPVFTDISEGSELFKMVTVEREKDIEKFVKQSKQKAEQQTEYFIISDFKNRDDFVFYSIIPWISFTSIDHTVNLRQDDAIPRVTIGKYYAKENDFYLPFNIQVNHLFVDGIHLGKLKDKIDEKIDKL
jgi:chloramphenicol O-acetyltransferase type A